MSKIYQLKNEEGQHILPVTVTDAVAAGKQSLTAVLNYLNNVDSSISNTLNNLVSVVEEMEKQHKTDIATLKNQINTLNDKLVDIEYNMLEKDAVDATTLYSTDSSTGEVSLNSDETIKYDLGHEESIIPESATEQRVLPISAKNILIS